MAIETPESSAQAVQAIHDAIVDRVLKNTFVSPALRNANPDSLSTAVPHRVMYLPLDGLRQGLALRTIAQPGSWRVLVYERRQKHVAIAAGTASESDQGGYEFDGLGEGPLVEGTEEAIRKAEERKDKGRFEPLLAVAPTIQVAALWLKNLDDESGNADIILAIPPSGPELTPYQAMTAGEFLAVLRRLAESLPPEDETAK